MLWMTFSLIYSMANRQCQLWACIFVVNPALKLKTTHAHRRYLYARECCRRETSWQCCSNAGPPSSHWTGIALASSGGVCKSRLTSRSDTQRLVVQLSHLSQFVQGSSQIEKHGFFLTLIRLIFC